MVPETGIELIEKRTVEAATILFTKKNRYSLRDSATTKVRVQLLTAEPYQLNPTSTTELLV